tara:strand:- start:58 stop:642 length:585 start_codon:yes stop_codon:yes gene_type:complete
MKKFYSKNLARKYYEKIRISELKKQEENIFKEVEKHAVNYMKEFTNSPEFYMGIYWPLKGEVDLRPLKNKLSNSIALPYCTKSKNIEYRSWNLNSINKDHEGIPSPSSGQIIQPEKISILYIPALAIDLKGIRLGYGGGYYDRLFEGKNWRSVKSVVVLPQECVSKKGLPSHSWDFAFDEWITENGPYKRKRIF